MFGLSLEQRGIGCKKKYQEPGTRFEEQGQIPYSRQGAKNAKVFWRGARFQGHQVEEALHISIIEEGYIRLELAEPPAD